MRASRIVLALVCGAWSVAAQNGSPAPGEPRSSPSQVTGEELPAQAAPRSAAPGAPTVAPPGATPLKAEDALPPTRRIPAENEPKSANVTPKYQIGPLDVLYIRVWNQPNMSGLYPVSPDGTISMPLVKVVKAEGLTVAGLETDVTRRLSDFINNPEVSIDVTKINSKSVLMIGGIGHPGKFPLTEKTTVLDAIVGSGGLKEFANKKKIYILRKGMKIMFNYEDVIKGKHLEQNIELENGDQIVIPE
jgi:polysaccharide export outer membrane protein